MKIIFFFFATLCIVTSGKAQEKNNAELPPIRTTDPVPVQRPTAVKIPIQRATVTAKQESAAVPLLPLRKTDMSNGASVTSSGNKIANDKSTVQLPSSSAVVTDSTSRLPRKE